MPAPLTHSVQALDIYIAEQDTEPLGWDDSKYGGAFPRGGVFTIKGSLPPTHKSWRDKGNFHTTTILLAKEDNPTNHLRLGPKLRRIVSHNCTCRSGQRTNSACCHVTGLVIELWARELFRSAKVQEPRLADPLK